MIELRELTQEELDKRTGIMLGDHSVIIAEPRMKRRSLGLSTLAAMLLANPELNKTIAIASELEGENIIKRMKDLLEPTIEEDTRSRVGRLSSRDKAPDIHSVVGHAMTGRSAQERAIADAKRLDRECYTDFGEYARKHFRSKRKKNPTITVSKRRKHRAMTKAMKKRNR